MVNNKTPNNKSTIYRGPDGVFLCLTCVFFYKKKTQAKHLNITATKKHFQVFLKFLNNYIYADALQGTRN